ncbi:Phage integrase, N-terminal SAM-like domain [Lentzea waywayandensis]|uniref:Phage integrase, N-terminal SAM-like domain n=1 Tax=Lentzea waywayandensis TaxID=84724 RepID=A0A1I6FHE3_9PSEU|nr:tyrosine-type recombinase/integrase [Lentzea waywayandensis]SFR29363.1 Phage integrase, N-terminal SAM-like domain [Lentzea waywayandensis]
MGRKKLVKDLTGIRKRGNTYQVRVYGLGQDKVTGKDIVLSGQAPTEDEAIKLRDSFRAQIATKKTSRSNAKFGEVLDEWLSGHDIEETTLSGYKMYVRRYLRPAFGEVTLTRLLQLGPKAFEDFATDVKRCRRRCKPRVKLIDHRTERDHKCDDRCKPHACKPLGPSSIRQIHAVMSGALNAAVRWNWIAFNPVDAAKKPRAPRPNPDPPTPEQAALLVNKAWEEDEQWGTLVWLTMVTGLRRGELLALRLPRIVFDHAETDPHSCETEGCRAVVEARTNIVIRDGKLIEKETKSHQIRRISVDPTTTDLLAAWIERVHARCEAADVPVTSETFLFSYAAGHDRHADPDGVTHRYSRMAASLGLKTHLHELRHYSATELLTAGVDLRTVAGRLGHGGGGATTLRVYAAWVPSADKQAADLLASRMPSRPPRERGSD